MKCKKQAHIHFLSRAALMITALCLALALVLLGSRRVSDDLRTQAQSSLKNTVLQCAVQCYAIEGIYPSNLTYLEENYGLVYNKNDFVVSYEAFASNEPPSITVLVRGT